MYKKPNGTVHVTVISGKVSVKRTKIGAARVHRASDLPSTFEIGQGHRMRLGPVGAQPLMDEVDAHQATAWLRREVVATRQPLGEVAHEFNRYASLPIVIEDGVIKETPISGTFSADDEESFLDFLHDLQGVTVEMDGQSARVQAAKDTDTGT